MPRVSAIIPVYNGEATIARAIDSAIDQDFGESVEVIVVNDCSSDSTEAILARYGVRIRYLTQTRRMGVVAARNAAVAAASGEYLALLDADDSWLPNKLTRLVPALDGNPNAVLAYADYIPVFPDGKQWRATSFTLEFAHAPSMDEMLTRRWPFAPSMIVMRRNAYLGADTFVERAAGNLRAGLGEDYMLLLAREQGEFIYIPEPLTRFQVIIGYESLDKWEPDVFIALVQERYGKRAHGMLRDLRFAYAGKLAYKANLELHQGRLLRALHTSMRAMRYDPWQFLRRDNLAKILSRRAIHVIGSSLRARWSSRGAAS